MSLLNSFRRRQGVILAGFLSLLLQCSGSRDYCVIGAGPGGLQMGYFFQSSNRDYIIFDKNSTAGSFYRHYPRHRTLISINKRHTGSTNEEFNFRHDWNSLISDDPNLRMTRYSKKYFPPADTIVQYFEDFAKELNLNIQYDTEITRVEKERDRFVLWDQTRTKYECKKVIIGTGLWTPNSINIPGIELIEGYESVSIDPEDFEGKSVLILGRGNAGFEIANNIVGAAAYIHMASRSRIKLAYQTHYVGDLRAINDELVDTYQLKSLDGQTEIDDSIGQAKFVKKNGKFYVFPLDYDGDVPEESDVGFFSPYDVIIRCLGFKFDYSLFADSANPGEDEHTKGKYPAMRPNYESTYVEGMFFVGAISHAIDYKRSAGGFIHGFRYTARALYRHLEWRDHGVPWPHTDIPLTALPYYMVKRINEASGPYQMFGVLGDVVILRDNDTAVYLEEVPLQALGHFKELTGHEPGRIIIFNFEYGRSYSGPGEDVLREDRATGDPRDADLSNFLHPVLYYYKELPFDFKGKYLPTPTSYHHMVEDFTTDWTKRRNHVVPLRRYIESIVSTDLRAYAFENCFEYLMMFGGKDVPLSCKQHFLQGLSTTLEEATGDPKAYEALVPNLHKLSYKV